MAIEIAPSILSADFSKLGEELKALEKAGADRIHVDVMDGHFVPNLTFGPPVIKAIRPHTTLPFDVHLMVEPVSPLLDAYLDAGADIVLFHPETESEPHNTIKRIKEFGAKAGVVINPEYEVSHIEPYLDNVDQVLIMTVNPGFGGQSFMEGCVDKIKALRDKHPDLDIEVDGGITPETAKICREAGANILVAGTAVFKTLNYKENIESLKI